MPGLEGRTVAGRAQKNVPHYHGRDEGSTSGRTCSSHIIGRGLVERRRPWALEGRACWLGAGSQSFVGRRTFVGALQNKPVAEAAKTRREASGRHHPPARPNRLPGGKRFRGFQGDSGAFEKACLRFPKVSWRPPVKLEAQKGFRRFPGNRKSSRSLAGV